jgi:hypothetical protein
MPPDRWRAEGRALDRVLRHHRRAGQAAGLQGRPAVAAGDAGGRRPPTRSSPCWPRAAATRRRHRRLIDRSRHGRRPQGGTAPDRSGRRTCAPGRAHVKLADRAAAAGQILRVCLPVLLQLETAFPLQEVEAVGTGLVIRAVSCAVAGRPVAWPDARGCGTAPRS